MGNTNFYKLNACCYELRMDSSDNLIGSRELSLEYRCTLADRAKIGFRVYFIMR